jgi:hypothetical protein
MKNKILTILKALNKSKDSKKVIFSFHSQTKVQLRCIWLRTSNRRKGNVSPHSSKNPSKSPLITKKKTNKTKTSQKILT